MTNADKNSIPKDSEKENLALNVGTRPKIGLALSSGGAKGLAHVGVIQVLEENGIHIDAVAGTSMGAYVGSLCAAGLNGQELEALAAEITDKRTMLELVDPVIPPRRGFIKGLKIKKRIERTLGKKHFSDLPKPLFVVATATDTFSARILKTGQVSDAVHASIAIPGVFEPVEIDGIEYVDGAISDPIPVEPLREAGMDIVIAVSVIPTSKELMVCELEANPPSKESADKEKEAIEKSKGDVGIMSRHFNYFAPGNVLDTLRRSVMGVQMRLAEVIAEHADLVIRPIHCDASFQDYSNFRALIDKGRETATGMLPEIKRVIEERTRELDIDKLPVA